MGGGSKTQTSTSTQTKDPWAPAQPALQGILAGSTNAFNSGVGSQVYGGDRVAGIGSTTQAGLDLMAANAGAGNAATQAGNAYLGGLLQNGGATAAGNAALAQIQGVRGVDTTGVANAAARMADPNNAASSVGKGLIGGQYNLDATGYQNLSSQLGTGTQTGRSLQDVADGKFIGGANPYLDQMISQSAGDAASATAQKFAASGRYGSGRFAGAVADANNRVETGLRYQDYDQERARQAAAASAIDSAANARTGVQSSLFDAMNSTRTANANQAVTGAGLASSADQAALSGANALAALQAQNNQQKLTQGNTALSAAQADRAAGLAGLGAVATNNANLQSEGKTLAGIGGVLDSAKQQQLDVAQQVFAEQQQAPWKQLGLYSGLVNPIASMGGQQTGTQTTQTPQPGLLQQILGGAATGVGILGQTGAFPTAAAGAGSAGWLASALPFLASDERVKEDIREVGELHDGQTVYAYKYKGNPTPQIGLLAQEVAKHRPDAVGLLSGGILGVNYDLATESASKMGSRR